MRDNVIDFPHAGRTLESRILEQRRLSSGDKAKFAENLGRLAAKVNPSDPLAGAQMITDKSALDGIWEKRKRYFRLPGEAAPASTKDGEYGSRPLTFVTLAHAAARLLTGSDRPDRIEAEQRRAIKRLAEGTSFAPAFAPTGPDEQTAKSLLDDYAARLSAAVVERTRIAELWRVLEASPFFIASVRTSKLSSIEPSPYGEAGEFPPSLLSSHFSDLVVAARFVTEETFTGIDWARPRIEIGRVAIPQESRIFVVPKDIAALLSPDNDREEGVASREADAWFKTIASDGGHLPEIEYSKRNGFGWRPCFLSVMCHVYLEVVPSADGSPAIQINTALPWDEAIAFSLWDEDIRDLERNIVETSFTKSQVRDVELSRHSFKVFHKMPFCEVRDKNFPPVVGIMERWNLNYGPLEDEFHPEGWTDNVETSRLLTSNTARFYPTVPDADPVNGPLISGSIGAAILHNVMAASQDTSLAAQIIMRAKLIADAGLRFHDALLDSYRESIRRI